MVPSRIVMKGMLVMSADILDWMEVQSPGRVLNYKHIEEAMNQYKVGDPALLAKPAALSKVESVQLPVFIADSILLLSQHVRLGIHSSHRAL